MTRASILQCSVVAVLGLGLLAAVLRLAWICDDAYITLRTVENLLAGHGLVWNVGERVQTFTHPLWMVLLVVVRWLSGEHFFATIALSVVLSGAAVVLLVRLARVPAAAAVLVLLLASRAFGDFATSGLETPLVMLLLVALVRLDDSARERTRLLPVVLLLALLGTTRLDLLVLAGPVVLAHMRGQRWQRVGCSLASGLAPLWLWSAFAAFYYGSPLPITAYAKAIATGVPAGDLFVQGWRYLVHTASTDPATMVVVGLGIAVGLMVRSLGGRALALGTLLYCGYVLRVGGDFMAGRFFVPPFAVALALLARWLRGGPAWRGVVLAVVGAGLAWVPGRPPYLHSPAHDMEPAPAPHGIQDERRFYYRFFGLFSPQRAIPQFGRFSTALRRQGRTRSIVLGSGMAGGVPFVAGELFHFVDPWLCDPLLMRLPVADPARWRIGHFTRAIPDGYLESLAFDDNLITHGGLRTYYADLRTVLRAPLWSGARLRSLAALWLGLENAHRRSYVDGEYRGPARLALSIDELASPPPEGTFWFDDRAVRCVGRGGWRLLCGRVLEVDALRITATPLVRYRFRFLRGDAEVGHSELLAVIDPGEPPAGDAGDVLGYLLRLLGVRAFEVVLPTDLPAFDAIDIDCEHEPWIQPVLGGLRLGR